MDPNPRYLAIDLARGIAMLGVALVNVHHYAVGWTMLYALDLAKTPWDVFAEYFVAILFSHRSYPVLAFLFGAGLALQWARLPEATRTPGDLRPRLWALLALGLVHGLLLWPGDVLATYAIVGLVGVGLVRRSGRRVATIAASVLVIATLLYALLGFSAILFSDAPRPWPWPETSSFSADTWRSALAQHPMEYLERGLAQLLVLEMWGWFALGLWAAQTGALPRFVAAPFARKGIVALGVAAFIGGTVVECFAALHGGWDARMYNDIGSGVMTVALVPASLGGLWLWFTLAALLSKRGDAKRGVASLAIATGRAPLTQFFGQSIVFAIVFNKSLIGWHGELGRFAYSMIAITTYILLSGFIRAWLANGHAHGPMEMLWRGLTRLVSSQRVDKYSAESKQS